MLRVWRGVRAVSGPDQLKILRDYRDGRVDDVSDLWGFMDTGINCQVFHRAKDLGIHISFFYAKPQPNIGMKVVQTPDGRHKMRAEPRASGTTSSKTTARREGPDISPGSVWIRFQVEDGNAPLESGSLGTGGRTWELHPESIFLGVGRQTVNRYSLIAVNDDAMAILQALAKPGKVVVNAVKALPGVTAVAPRELEPRAVQLETRTIQFVESAKEMMGCIDGSTRNPEPAFN